MNKCDLIIFAGQSNMAGRGDIDEAPLCFENAGAEFRAVSDPTRLYALYEPIGKNENRAGLIDDKEKKRGGLIGAFVVRYHEITGRRTIVVSASQGGTDMASWQRSLADDAAQRLASAKSFLEKSGIECGNIFMAWCQGESDGDNKTPPEAYEKGFDEVWRKVKNAGATRCFLITIGHFNYKMHPDGIEGFCDGNGLEIDRRYAGIRERQRLICQKNEDVVEAGSFEGHLELMRDAFHYFQPAYNKVGEALAESVAGYVMRRI